MSRAFVNEDLVADSATPPERLISRETNYVTPRGLNLLEARLAELSTERSALKVHDEISARDRLAEVERDMDYYAARIESARLVPVPTQAPEQVTFGTRVSVATPDGEERDYTLVGEDEADVSQGLISWVSPLGKALLGARETDEVIWRRPAGDVQLEVIEIALPEKK
ncbi:MAG: GreA/GreB family elongation factor [Gammaproteobacteria bacterium]|nr:GreA/GreB family elongation factor [Gammaproteobacteria bacterium]MBA3731931.1 GreA/GreB family elongation factor [Gammaproteobacteria bacterium]